MIAGCEYCGRSLYLSEGDNCKGCGALRAFLYREKGQMNTTSYDRTSLAGVTAGSTKIKIIKAKDACIIPNRKDALLKRMADMESELGRMVKLLNEMRADVLHLSVE